tara:strand:+ start:593 stop:1273 length:681 start_codon:yes stop_codon:yes gene_type:complete
MVQISKKDLALLALGWGIADFLTEGRLQKPVSRATKSALSKAAPAIARGIIRYGPRVAMTAARITPGPVAAAALGVTAISQRERIMDAAGNVYERVAPAAQQYGAGVVERALDPETYQPMGEPTDILPLGGPIKRPTKKRLSKFNQAIKKGMSIVKQSTSFGKKGTITNSKKAFSTVTKAASAVSKGRKPPKSGVKRKLFTEMKKILKTKGNTKKKSKIDIQVYKK